MKTAVMVDDELLKIRLTAAAQFCEYKRVLDESTNIICAIARLVKVSPELFAELVKNRAANDAYTNEVMAHLRWLQDERLRELKRNIR